jgi:hypothetical protein
MYPKANAFVPCPACIIINKYDEKVNATAPATANHGLTPKANKAR